MRRRMMGNLKKKSVFVSYKGNYKIVRGGWVTNKYSVELSEDVFGDASPAFTMYYINNGAKTSISVTATKDTASDGYVYKLKFKAPNVVGTFPIEVHYVVNDKESSDFISASMKISR